ncbi:hypothetical protein GF358_00845 [Candidatus Woesearchaeota archaeon]|nr:hypothetical protein [Candidatus Woesearchaeota archaeon]
MNNQKPKIKAMGREYPIEWLSSPPELQNQYIIRTGDDSERIIENIERYLRENTSLTSQMPENTLCVMYETPAGIEAALTSSYTPAKEEIEEREFQTWFEKQKKTAKQLLYTLTPKKIRNASYIRDLTEKQAKEMLRAHFRLDKSKKNKDRIIQKFIKF